MRLADGAVHGPGHRSRPNDTGAAASSKMRDPPEKLTAAPHEVSADVMKPWGSSLSARAGTASGSILGYQWCEYLHVRQERGFPRPGARAIDPLENDRSTR